MAVHPRGKAVWVTCPYCSFPFYCGPEYLDPSRGAFPDPEVDKEQYLQCPKCKKTFKIDESRTKPGVVPERLLRSYLTPDFTLDEIP